MRDGVGGEAVKFEMEVKLCSGKEHTCLSEGSTNGQHVLWISAMQEQQVRFNMSWRSLFKICMV